MSHFNFSTLLALSLTVVSTSAFAFGGPSPSAATAEKLKLPDGPASVAGLTDEANIGVFSGQVSYSIPINMPAGVSLSPSVALTYNGALGNSSIGVGWTLGLPAITRSTREGVPTYDDNVDTFEISGIASGRLVHILSGAGYEEYRVEAAGNAYRVRHMDDDSWEVTDTAGTKYIFGENPGERMGVDVAAGWKLSRIVNIVGEEVVFSYWRDRGHLYPSTISWGPDNQASNPKYTAYFDYDEETDRPDPVSSYKYGYREDIARRLHRIRVLYNATNTRLSTYILRYDETLPLSRLESVCMAGYNVNANLWCDEPGINVQEDILPPLTFTYGGVTAFDDNDVEVDIEAAKVINVSTHEGWVLNERGTSFVDVDGDGVSDLLQLEWGNQRFQRNEGGTFGADTFLDDESLELGIVQLMDVDGDARPEMVSLVDDSWRVFEMDTTGFTYSHEVENSRGVPLYGDRIVQADVNGDGRTDVIQAAGEGAMVYLMKDDRFEDGFLTPPLDEDNVNVAPGEPGVFFHDINGDSLVDVMWLREHAMKTYLGRGDGTFEFDADVSYPFEDILINPKDIRFADLNRDGLLDLIKLSGGNITYYRGLPGGFHDVIGTELKKPSEAEVDVAISFADVNGNGSTDVVWSSAEGMWALDFAGATTKAMLTGIENGMGKTTTFDYAPSSELAFGAEDANNPWSRKLPTIVPVPTGVTIDMGSGLERDAIYEVRDGFWDSEERKFGGFLQGIQYTIGINDDDSLRAVTHYHEGIGEDRALRGMAIYARTEIVSGEVLSETTTTNATCDPFGGIYGSDPKLFVATTTDATTTHYEGLASPITTKTYTEFDAECRPIRQVNEGRSDIQGDETVGETSYVAANTTDWIRDLPCTSTAKDLDGNVVTDSRTFYGTHGVGSTVEDLCGVPSKGWVRRTEGYNDDTTSWMKLSETEYSEKGNPTATWAGGTWRYFVYDEEEHPIEEKVYADQADTSTAIVWEMTWDKVRNLPIELTSPDEVSTHVSYDNLGRVTSMRLSTQQPTLISKEPHIVYDYRWYDDRAESATNAPFRPRTETFLFKGSFEDLSPLGEEEVGDWLSGADAMHSVAIANGGGEPLYSAVFLDDNTNSREWIVSGFNNKDLLGRTVEMYEPCYMPDTVDILADSATVMGAVRGDCTELPTEGHRSQTFEYDAQGRVRKQVSASGKTKEATFTAFSTTTIVPDLADVVSYVDGLGRVIRTERDVDGALEGVNATYDTAGRITAMTLTGGTRELVTHSFTYNSLGQLTFATDPDIGDRYMVYDNTTYSGTNRLLHHENGEGEKVYFEYDDIGRLTRRNTTGLNSRHYQYFYDRLPGVAGFDEVANHTLGRLAFVGEPNHGGNAGGTDVYESGIQISYDALGRQENVKRAIKVGSVTEIAEETVTWSMSGLPLSLDHHDGFKVQTIFDRASRPTAIERVVSGGNTAIWTAGNLDASGRITTEEFGNGLEQTYSFDADGLVEGTIIKEALLPSNKLYDVSLTRNGWGGITTVTDALPTTGINHGAEFTYDNAARLTAAKVGNIGEVTGEGDFYEFTYAYDALQNMVSRTATKNGNVSHGLELLNGSYLYGEGGHGPRQLSRVINPNEAGTYHLTQVVGDANTTSGEGVPGNSVFLDRPGEVLFSGELGVAILEAYGSRVRVLDEQNNIETRIGHKTEGIHSWGDNQLDPDKVKYDSIRGMDLDAEGRLITVSIDIGRMRRVNLETGEAETLSGEGSSQRQHDNGPTGLTVLANMGNALDVTVHKPTGTIYYITNHYLLRAYDPDTDTHTALGAAYPGTTGDNQDVAHIRLNGAYGLEVSTNDDIYICEANRIRKVAAEDANGDRIVTTQRTTTYGTPTACALDNKDNPTAMFVSAGYKIYHVPFDANVGISAIGGTGALGYTGDTGPAISAKIGTIYSLEVLPHLTEPNKFLVYFTDQSYGRVRKIDTNTGNIDRVLGGGTSTANGATATDFKLYGNGGLAVVQKPEGVEIITGDPTAGRIVRKDTAGNAEVISGKPGTFTFHGDGGGRHDLYITRVTGAAMRTDANGNFTGDWLLTDGYLHNKILVLQEGKGPGGADLVSTLTLTAGSYGPSSVTIDGDFVFLTFASGSNSRAAMLELDWSTNPPTIVSEEQIAGSGPKGLNTETEALLAQLNLPEHGAVAPDGSYLIADTNNHCIRRIPDLNATPRTIETFAGTCGTAGNTGDGGDATLATLNLPEHFTIGESYHTGFNVYITDTASNRVRKVAYDYASGVGTITNFAGGGTQLPIAGVHPTSAVINSPQGLAFDPATNELYIAGFLYGELYRVYKGDHTEFDYDDAGRMTKEGDRDLIYDELDQLIEVVDNSSGSAVTLTEHAYGYEGLRTSTVRGSDVERWFTDNLVQFGDSSNNPNSVIRHHYVKLGDRLIARIDQCHGSLCAGADGGGGGGAFLFPIWWSLFSALLMGLAYSQALRSRLAKVSRLFPLAFSVTMLAVVSSCANFGLQDFAGTQRAIDFTAVRTGWHDDNTTYFHKGISAGPTLLTKADGTVLDERQYEPFGQKISGDQGLDPHGWVNKPHDTATGYSYHGARWFSPGIARWLTPDPPVKGPDTKFMDQPWALHPYQYVEQNPVLYWDPDGNDAQIHAPMFDYDESIDTTKGVRKVRVVKATPERMSKLKKVFDGLDGQYLLGKRNALKDSVGVDFVARDGTTDGVAIDLDALDSDKGMMTIKFITGRPSFVSGKGRYKIKDGVATPNPDRDIVLYLNVDGTQAGKFVEKTESGTYGPRVLDLFSIDEIFAHELHHAWCKMQGIDIPYSFKGYDATLTDGNDRVPMAELLAGGHDQKKREFLSPITRWMEADVKSKVKSSGQVARSKMPKKKDKVRSGRNGRYWPKGQAGR